MASYPISMHALKRQLRVVHQYEMEIPLPWRLTSISEDKLFLVLSPIRHHFGKNLFLQISIQVILF